jgi:hypothetical protein
MTMAATADTLVTVIFARHHYQLGRPMLVEFRPDARLRGKNPVALGATLDPVIRALAETGADLSRVRVTCDWIQYKQNFRGPIDVRPVMPASSGGSHAPFHTAAECEVEVAIDIRRADQAQLAELAAGLAGGSLGRVYLEDWRLGKESCIWAFNALYWSALELWEKASGQSYEQALPGGESDARNRDAARDLITGLFDVWDPLAASGALPNELYVAELGVGNGNQAKVFLDEFRALDHENGRGYYRRLHYLMCDYSPYVLDLARETVAEHTEHVSSVSLDATRPCTSLGFLRDRAFLLYISNVYDNLPTDEVAHLGGQSYAVETRAYLPPDAAGDLAAAAHASPGDLPGLISRLLRLGPAVLPDAAPAHFSDTGAAVRFWRDAWSAVRLEERYVPLRGLDTYPVSPGFSGEILRPLLEAGGDNRMHVSNGAIASLMDSLQLLHPFGRLVCHDLFVTEAAGYRTGFRGPGKYDGSVVNWVNGALLAHAGRRAGFDVGYEPFRHRGGGNIITMTASARD